MLLCWIAQAHVETVLPGMNACCGRGHGLSAYYLRVATGNGNVGVPVEVENGNYEGKGAGHDPQPFYLVDRDRVLLLPYMREVAWIK